MIIIIKLIIVIFNDSSIINNDNHYQIARIIINKNEQIGILLYIYINNNIYMMMDVE